MDFFAAAKTTSLTIPEPLPSITHGHGHTKSHHHHHPSSSPHHGHGHHDHHGHGHGSGYAYEHVGKVGKSALWVYFTILLVSFFVIALMAKRVERKLRLFHWISLVIVGTAMVSYLCMASGLGVDYVRSYKDTHDGTVVLRQVFWARYVDWSITTPLLLLDLALLAGLPLTTTILVMIADEGMILTGLFGGLSSQGEASRWLFFGVSDVFFLYVLWTLLVSGRSAAKLQSSNIQRVYNGTMLLTVVLWIAYPIVFALTEGKGTINADAEVLIYGVLDILAKVGFSFYLLLAHSHTEGDSIVISEFWVEPRGAARGYGAISQDD